MYVSRDPYAREELHKERVKRAGGCDWCGNEPKRGLFQYYVEPDSVRYTRHDIRGLFCSVGCMRTYHHG